MAETHWWLLMAVAGCLILLQVQAITFIFGNAMFLRNENYRRKQCWRPLKQPSRWAKWTPTGSVLTKPATSAHVSDVVRMAWLDLQTYVSSFYLLLRFAMYIFASWKQDFDYILYIVFQVNFNEAAVVFLLRRRTKACLLFPPWKTFSTHTSLIFSHRRPQSWLLKVPSYWRRRRWLDRKRRRLWIRSDLVPGGTTWWATIAWQRVERKLQTVST